MQRVIDDLKSIIKIARDYEFDAQSEIDGYDYLITDIENLVKEYEIEQGKQFQNFILFRIQWKVIFVKFSYI